MTRIKLETESMTDAQTIRMPRTAGNDVSLSCVVTSERDFPVTIHLQCRFRSAGQLGIIDCVMYSFEDV